MKTMFLLLGFVAFTTVAAAQNPTPQKERELLQDFRVDQKISDIRIPAATQRNVLSKVFRKYLTDSNRCNSDFDTSKATDPLAEARKAGQIVPSILDMATGSFTAEGKTQTLYVISVSECTASHADNFGTKRVAIFAGQQLVVDVDADFASSIVRKTDLNHDGIDELLMITGDMAQGTVTQMGTLVSFQNGRRRVIQDFGTVVEDSCASEMQGATSDASVLYISDAVPGNMPKITQENYSASCRVKSRRWKLVSRGKRQ
jgi:roadblock/LC7 domain-containing protein